MSLSSSEITIAVPFEVAGSMVVVLLEEPVILDEEEDFS